MCQTVYASKFNVCQRGFMKSRPTATNLATYLDLITCLVYSQRQVDDICLRFINASGPVLQDLFCQHSVTADRLYNLVQKLLDQQNI
jgi:hypothetical protein